VRVALEFAAQQGLRVEPQCSYVAVFISRHPEFQPLVDRPT
jgi:predicted GNAT family acetyltransferase